MNFVRAFFALLVCANTVSAQCNPGDFPQNGLYYSPTGSPLDARQISPLKDISDDKDRFTALEGRTAHRYRADGRFFLRSGVGGQPWLAFPPSRGQEALLIRRVTQSATGVPADFISIYRRNLAANLCPTLPEQRGLSDERNFVDTADYILFHSDRRERLRNPLIDEQFHFRFQDANSICGHSADVLDADTGKDMTVIAYIGANPRIGTAGEDIISRSATQVAQIFLPRPAYASPGRRQQMIVTGMEASLHHLDGDPQVCVSFAAPIPTARVARGLAWIFNRVHRHERKAVEMARNGEWQPGFTEIHLQHVKNSRQHSLIRVFWP